MDAQPHTTQEIDTMVVAAAGHLNRNGYPATRRAICRETGFTLGRVQASIVRLSKAGRWKAVCGRNRQRLPSWVKQQIVAMGHAGLQPTAIAKAMADRGYPISRWTAAIYSTTHIPRPGPPTPQQLQEWEQQLLQYLETKRAEGLVPNRKQTAEDLEFSASRLRRLIKDIRRKGIPVFRANYHHRKPRQKRQQPEEILTPEQIRLRCLMVRKGLL